jgi:DNA-binding beta-propeller fold protein YncE
MKQHLLLATVLLGTAVMLSGIFSVASAQDPEAQFDPPQNELGLRRNSGPHQRDKIVVANRASGMISVINSTSDKVIGTYALPAGDKMPEPMYVVYTRGRVFVNDRANNRVVIFHPRTFAVEGLIPTGAGSWHMWADPTERQLWVNNETDKTCTVIDLLSRQVLTTVPIPADLAAAGGRPHDVILDPVAGQFAFVTLIGVTGPADYVVKFSTQTFSEVGRMAVGKDPHVSASRHNNLLYLPCQNSNLLLVLNRDTLAQVTSLPLPGAHGAALAANGETFYTTNLPGGGADGLWTVDTRTNTVVGEPLDVPFTVPHNLALTPGKSPFSHHAQNSRKLYLTHSGATNNKVTVYQLKNNLPVFHKEITVGFNPFGLSYVP